MIEAIRDLGRRLAIQRAHQQDRLAGLLTDFHFRHTPEDYPRPWCPRIKALKRSFAALPLASVLLTWAFCTPMPCFRC